METSCGMDTPLSRTKAITPAAFPCLPQREPWEGDAANATFAQHETRIPGENFRIEHTPSLRRCRSCAVSPQTLQGGLAHLKDVAGRRWWLFRGAQGQRDAAWRVRRRACCLRRPYRHYSGLIHDQNRPAPLRISGMSAGDPGSLL